MPLATIKKNAENEATKDTESLRRTIISEVAVAEDLSGWKGQSVVSSIQSEIDRSFGDVSDFTDYYRQAYEAGILRANKELKGAGQSLLRFDSSDYVSKTKYGFKKIVQGLESDVVNRITLQRDAVRQILLRSIGNERETGLFRNFASQARGIVSHEVDIAEAMGYRDRIIEGNQQKLQAIIQGTSQDKKANQAMGKGLEPYIVKIWRHHDVAERPRVNHIEMSGKGVFEEMLFHLPAADGSMVYWTDVPKAKQLPIEETAHCHCTADYATVFLAKKDYGDMKAQMMVKGGMYSKLWSID